MKTALSEVCLIEATKELFSLSAPLRLYSFYLSLATYGLQTANSARKLLVPPFEIN
jgi:hypothetical protein